MRISLLHATYRAGKSAVETRDLWFSTALAPSRVEHIFACDEDDLVSMRQPEIVTGVVGRKMVGQVSAVRNWNSAASVAHGDLLFVIADDLSPPMGWDETLRKICGKLNPLQVPFVVKASDHLGDEVHLIRHPIISRAYYERHGLWNSKYQGYLVDDDFSYSAHLRNLVIDGRSLQLTHLSPLRGGTRTESHSMMATSRENGERVFRENWPVWKRRMVRWPLRATARKTSITSIELVLRGAVARLPFVLVVVPTPVLRRLRKHVRGVQAL